MSSAETLLEAIVGRLGALPAAGPAPIRAFAWARVSTDGQNERGQSIPEQFREMRAHATGRGIEIVGEFSEATSAFQHEEKRVEFHRMLTQAKADPRVNAILVHDYSRFSRDSIYARSLIRELLKKGISVLSATDLMADPESVAGVYLEAINHAKNEAYSREVAFHTRKGCRSNVQTQHPGTGHYYTNGGQPLWGYKIHKLVIGQDKKGEEIRKSIWVLDDSIVADRPVHEWVHHVLVEMAGQGASLNEMRDLCEARKLPARRKDHWGTSTINAVLGPYVLAKYTGLGIWNVHDKNGRFRPQGDRGRRSHGREEAAPAHLGAGNQIGPGTSRGRADLPNPGANHD